MIVLFYNPFTSATFNEINCGINGKWFCIKFQFISIATSTNHQISLFAEIILFFSISDVIENYQSVFPYPDEFFFPIISFIHETIQTMLLVWMFNKKLYFTALEFQTISQIASYQLPRNEKNLHRIFHIH